MPPRYLQKTSFASLTILASLVTTSFARAGDPSPVLGEETAAVVKVDLTRLDVANLSRRWFGPSTDAPEFAAIVRAADERVSALKGAGATELFLVFDFGDFPGPPLIAVPNGPKVAANAVIDTLTRGLPGFSIKGAVGEVVGGMILVGRPAALARVRDRKPTARPDLIAALAEGGLDAPIRAAISPGIALRRAVEESMPILPVELGGGPITPLTKGMSWLSVTSPTETTTKLRATFQTTDPGSAQALIQVFKRGSEWAERTLAANSRTGELAPAIGQLKPESRGDRVVAELDLGKALALIAVPIRQVREATEMSRSVDNLKQIGLAMHNYHSTHDTFPPAYRVDANQKPLLSWRVLILPYLDERKLYDEFHLDEPWDSPVNKPLIARMPKIYASPFEGRPLVAEGKTIYLTPRGKMTVFPGESAIKIKDISDGISNTIMILEAGDADAVIWTKPDDWEVETRFPPPQKRLIVAFSDGSVKTLPEALKPENLKKLLTRNGGEVLSADDF